MRHILDHNEQLRRSSVSTSLCIIKYINSISLHFTQIYTVFPINYKQFIFQDINPTQ